MPILTQLRNTFRFRCRNEELERDLDEELEGYLYLLTREKIEGGMRPEQARRQARIELGGVEQVKTRVRMDRHGAGFDSLRQDIRYTIRTLRKAPGFSVVVILTLAIGIGATTALFSTINAVLLRRLPYPSPDRLVVGTKTIDGRRAGPVSRLDFFDYRDRSTSFDDVAALSPTARLSLTGGERPEPVDLVWASWNLFKTVGVEPVAGRAFTPEEETRGGAATVVISHDFWIHRFARSPEVVGAVLQLDSRPFTVVGVMPPGFEFLFSADVWGLIDRDGPYDEKRDQHSHIVVGRLANGVSIGQAQADVDAISTDLEQLYPDTNASKALRLEDLHSAMVSDVRMSLMLLVATAGLVLLIACGNVAGLMLARGQRRLSEMAMRSALGAPRRRLIRQLLTESLMLTAVAGIAGVGVAYAFQRLLLNLLPLEGPGIAVPTIDGWVLVFALVVSILTGVVVGITPALRGTAFDITGQLKTETRMSEGRAGGRLRSALVIGQVAISVVLLIGSTLLVRSLANLSAVDPGFDPENLLAGLVEIPVSDYPTPMERNGFFSSLLAEIEALPGVERAASISKLPIVSGSTDWPIWPAEEPRPATRDSRFAMARWASPGYFETVQIPLIRGRELLETDVEGSPFVLVVSESVASGLFPGEDAIGRMVNIGWFDPVFEIVGIVGDARLNRLRSEAEWAMYLASAQVGANMQWLAVRTDRDPDRFVEPVSEILRGMNPNVMFSDPATMESVIDDELAESRVVLLALGLLSAIALLLTTIGLYGMLAYNVSERIQEFGIRLAIGASAGELVLLVVNRGVVLVGTGLVLGLAGAVFGGRLIRNMLYEIQPIDVVSFGGAAVFLGSVAMIACILPAWRATRVAPVDVLRRE